MSRNLDDASDLRSVERRFRSLVEHSADGIATVGADGIVRYMSPGAERALGLEPGWLVGKSSLTLTHPDDVAIGMQVLAPGQVHVVTTRSRHRDGSWRWLESTVTDLTHDPAIATYVVNFRDVTDRKRTERELQTAHARLELLLSATSIVTYSARPTGNCPTYVSPNALAVMGHEASAFVADPDFWLDHIHPDDRAAVVAGLARVHEHRAIDLDYRFQHRDGSWRWFHDEARLVDDDAGPELVGHVVDITDRRAAEDSLRRSEANFRMLIERAPMATLVHRDGVVRYANPWAIAALGYDSADELVGKALVELIHPADRASVSARIAKTASGVYHQPDEARMKRRDGSWVTMEGEAIVVEMDGRRSHMVVGRDVSERREMFARMALADRMLSVGTLAAGVAHEINSPLSYVVSNLAVLEAELPALVAGTSRLSAAELGTLLADAREGAARVSAIVRDLRALSRSDEARGPVDVTAVLASSLKMAANELRHRARVVHELAGDLPRANANASRLGQVFLNLLVNAAQAIEPGHADANEVRVRAFAAGEDVVVEVEDTGAGIAPSVVGRIFDPFFTTKPVGVGIGLGLAISHEIVRSLGGSITVTSALGRGSTFRVTLPTATGPAVVAVAAAPPGRAQTTTRVLMIDDDAAVGRSIQVLLAPDYDIVPVTRAKEALARLAAGEQFDAILCDLMMPEMTGIELYQQLAATAPAYLPRVVFMTGGAFTQQARDFLASNRQPTVEKPFAEDELRRAIERVRA